MKTKFFKFINYYFSFHFLNCAMESQLTSYETSGIIWTLSTASNRQNGADQFPGHWRSSDSIFLDFLFWGHIKSLVYVSPVTSTEDLVAPLSLAAEHVLDIHDLFSIVRQSMYRYCESCIIFGDHCFEQLKLLKTFCFLLFLVVISVSWDSYCLTC